MRQWILRDSDVPNEEGYGDLAGGPSHEVGPVKSWERETESVTECNCRKGHWPGRANPQTRWEAAAASGEPSTRSHHSFL